MAVCLICSDRIFWNRKYDTGKFPIAVATPTIFPVPIVAASAVVNAENGDTSPSPLLFVLDSLLNVFLTAHGRFLHVRKLHRMVKRIPVPTRSTSITGPHTKASTSDMILLSISISPLSDF